MQHAHHRNEAVTVAPKAAPCPLSCPRPPQQRTGPDGVERSQDASRDKGSTSLRPKVRRQLLPSRAEALRSVGTQVLLSANTRVRPLVGSNAGAGTDRARSSGNVDRDRVTRVQHATRVQQRAAEYRLAEPARTRLSGARVPRTKSPYNSFTPML
jgi:hypothetical protein